MTSDCGTVEQALLHGESVEGDGVRAHVAACASCRFLVEEGGGVAHALADAEGAPVPLELDRLAADTRAAIAAERGPIAAARALPRPARLVALALFVALEGLLFYLFLRRGDFDAYPAARMAATLALYGGLALALGWLAMRPLYLPPPPRALSRALLGVGLLAPIVAALLPEVPSATPTSPPMAYAYYCFVVGGGLGLAVILVSRVLDRGGHALPASAALAAVAGGLVGALGVHIECPLNHPLHLLLGHATIPAGLLLGTWLFRRSA